MIRFLIPVLLCLVLAGPLWATSCEPLAPATLRSDLEQQMTQVLRQRLAAIDYRALVLRQWRELELDPAWTGAVNAAGALVEADSSYMERLASLYSPGTAEELSGQLIERLLSSPTLETLLQRLGEAVTRDLSDQMQAPAEVSAGQSIACLQRYLGESYGTALQMAFMVRVIPATREGMQGGLPGQQALEAAAPGTGLITGAALLVFRQSVQRAMRRMGEQLLMRMGGRLASRAVPVVGWGLIGFELWSGRNGILPSAMNILREEQTREEIRHGMADSLRQVALAEAHSMAESLAGELHGRWIDFQREYRRTLELADRHPAVRQLLQSTSNDRLVQLSALLQRLLRTEGEARLVQLVEEGQLRRAMQLPVVAIEYIERAPDIDRLLAWQRETGALLDRAIEAGLVQHHTSQALSPAAWQRLLQLPLELLRQIAPLSVDALGGVYALPAPLLEALSRRLPRDDLNALGQVLAGLAEAQRLELAELARRNPPALTRLGESHLIGRVRSSPDPAAALAFLLTPSTFLGAAGELGALFEPTLGPVLWLDKHGWGWSLVPVVLVLMLLRRLFRRKKSKSA